ncbi:hypothetical protein BCF44_105409 [Kutzneria buriramensis]|uniref:Nudix hydrolase domain-containing protein n=2 Tax=Kutzneria buriramensis TaxID=1045776 RepID=A0A3E0HQK5_9PSEU|nr:hypothetical protein BCF44_105409 [Kutzneria buriramensis]
MGIVWLVLGVLLGGPFGVICAVLFQDRWKARVERRKRLHVANAITRMQHQGDGMIHIAGRPTTVHLVEGDGSLVLEPEHVDIDIQRDPVPLPPEVAAVRERVLREMDVDRGNSVGVVPTWNSKRLVALRGYRISRTSRHEKSRMQLETAPVDYATFCATVLRLDEEFERVDGSGATVRTTLRRDYLTSDDAVVRPVPFLANGLGIALLAFTDDDKVLLGRRRPTARARGGERDVSVVEGMHSKMDRNPDGSLSAYRTAVRGCEEELGVQVEPADVRLLGFAVDMKYYQWNFYGRVNVRLSAAEVIEAQRLHAKDRWEAKLEPVDLDPEAIFERMRQDGIWDTGLVAAYLALCSRLGPEPVRRAAERVFGAKPDHVPWRR